MGIALLDEPAELEIEAAAEIRVRLLQALVVDALEPHVPLRDVHRQRDPLRRREPREIELAPGGALADVLVHAPVILEP